MGVKSVLTCVDSALQLFSFSHTEVKFGLKLNVFRRLFITREISEIDSLRSSSELTTTGLGGSGMLRARHCRTGFCWGTLIVWRRALWLAGSWNPLWLAGSNWANFDISEFTLPLFRRKISSSILAPSPTYDFSLKMAKRKKKWLSAQKNLYWTIWGPTLGPIERLNLRWWWPGFGRPSLIWLIFHSFSISRPQKKF